MSAKSLPIVVVKELEYLVNSVQELIEESALGLTIIANDDFGFRVNYKNDKRIYFSVNSFEISNKTVRYEYVTVPNDLYTILDDARELIQKFPAIVLLGDLKTWISNIREYEQYSPNDYLPTLFRRLQNEGLLPIEADRYSEKNKILSHCLKSLSIIDFQGVKRTVIENLPIDTNWIFLVGENGFGKSTILQAIALALHGPKDGPYDYLNNDLTKISVNYKKENVDTFNEVRQNPNPLPQFAAFGPVRLNMQIDATMSEAAQKSGTLYSLFKTDGVLLNIESELVKWHLKKDKRFELTKHAFLKLVPYLADIQFNKKNDRIEYLEKDMTDMETQYEPLPFENIASGFRSILGIAGDMIVRLSSIQKDVTNPSDLRGIVIIDEIDLHWHPKLQKQIPELFSEVFPNIQFIVSTHSPIPLLGAPKNSVILKVNRTKEEGITVEKIDIDLKTLTPNLILTSDVFDMDDIFSKQLEDLTEVRTEDTFEEMEKNDDIDQYLNEFEKSSRQFPDELFEPRNK